MSKGRIVGTFHLVDALKAEDFPLPDEVREARLVMGVHTAMVIQYDIFVTADNLAKLGRALARLADWKDPEPAADDERMRLPDADES